MRALEKVSATGQAVVESANSLGGKAIAPTAATASAKATASMNVSVNASANVSSTCSKHSS